VDGAIVEHDYGGFSRPAGPFGDKGFGALQPIGSDDGFSAATPAASGCSGKAGAYAFANKVAFELSEGGEHVEQEPTAGVMVSIALVRDRRPAPLFSDWVTVSIKCGSERARRSSFQVTRTSPSRTKAMACANPSGLSSRPMHDPRRSDHIRRRAGRRVGVLSRDFNRSSRDPVAARCLPAT